MQEKHEGVVSFIKEQDTWNSTAQEQVYSMIYRPEQKYDGNSYIGAVLNKISSTPEQLVQFTKMITDQYDFEKGFDIQGKQKEANNLKKGLRQQLGSVLQANTTSRTSSDKQTKTIDWSKTNVVLPFGYD